MYSPTDPESGGCFSKLVSLWILCFLASLILALVWIAKPQDLGDIGGYEMTGEAGEARDLHAVLQASLRHGHPLSLTESEINHWLGRTLKMRQGGILADHVSLDRVWVRLEDGLAEIIMERQVMGQPFTVSMFLQIEQTQDKSGRRTVIERHGGRYVDDFPIPKRGGRFGSLVVPQGFLKLVVPAFSDLAELYREEIRLALEAMARVSIEPNRFVLHPRQSTDSATTVPGVY